ncbi:MAG: HAMP domain-containing protein [Chitinophagales bacterium]
MMKRTLFRGLSIQRRLPLFIGLLLLSVVITFGCISYFSVRNEALKTGKERLRSLSDQLSTMLAQSAQQTLTASRTAAKQESIIKSLQTGEQEYKIEALEVMRKLRSDTNWVLAELLTANRQPVLLLGKDSIQTSANFVSLLPRLDSAYVGKISLLKNSMYYPVSVPVVHDKRLIGFLVRWQKVATSEQGLERLSRLMGAKSKLYLGNKDGSLWTNMMKPVAYQKLDSIKMREPFEYSNSDGEYIASARPIANTSWLIAVEFPRQSVMGAANRFLRQITLIGAVLVIIGIFIGWLMSRRITKPLNTLTGAATTIAKGDYSATVEVERLDEVGKLSRAFNTMIGQVNKAKNGLEQKIVETAEMNEQLRDLSAYLQNVREDERIHIAREMHDELGQVLTGFKMDVSWLRKKLAGSNDPVLIEKLDSMLAVIDESVKFVRKLASELRPSLLDDLGLIPALEWHSQEFEKRYNIKIEFHSNSHDVSVPAIVATGLFRVYQESLTNVARHSNATRVVVNLRVISDEISLLIADNGKGFDASQANKKTLGLLGMKERAAMIGGHLEITSEPGRGTTIIMTVKHMVTERAIIS